MESANVTVLRQLEEFLNARNLDAYLELVDPEAEWHVAREDPDTGVHHGREEVRGYLERWIDSFSDLHIRMEETHVAGDQVLAVLHMQGHGSESGAPFDQRVSFIFSLRNGLVTKVEEFFDHGEALRAAGLDQARTK
jgi:ketosteroid isomerase-like protein